MANPKSIIYGDYNFASNGYVTLTGSTHSFDQWGSGHIWTYTYLGAKRGIDILEAQLELLGVRTSRTNVGSEFQLVATYAGRDLNQTAPEVPNDSWGFDTEAQNVSIWAEPHIFNQSIGFAGGSAAYQKTVTDALAAGESVSFGDYRDIAFGALSRGEDLYEVRSPMLRRTRTFSPQYYDKDIIEPKQTAWKTSSLVSAFSVPSDVSRRIPADPSSDLTPIGSVWAWKLTVDTSEYVVATRRWTETKQWIFRAWYTPFINVV